MEVKVITEHDFIEFMLAVEKAIMDGYRISQKSAGAPVAYFTHYETSMVKEDVVEKPKVGRPANNSK